MSVPRNLSKAEKELNHLLGNKHSNWKAVAKLAIAVRQNEWHAQSGLTFSAWVQQIAGAIEGALRNRAMSLEALL